MFLRKLAIVAVVLGAAVAPLRAQSSKQEVGLLLGATFIPSHSLSGPTGGKLTFNSGTALQATYARRVVKGGIADLLFEVPLVTTPSSDIRGDVNSTRLIASLFVTPGLRVKLLPGSRISPFFSVGGGYARFDASTRTLAGTVNPTPAGVNTGVLQVGGGVDVKFWRFVGLRGEVRDFYSGIPRFNVNVTDDKQHHVVASGGIVLHF